MVLDGLEKKLREKYPKATSKSRNAKVNFVRYCDDFIITGSSKELLVQVKPRLENYSLLPVSLLSGTLKSTQKLILMTLIGKSTSRNVLT